MFHVGDNQHDHSSAARRPPRGDRLGAHFVQGKSIKAICRELRVSRKTVRKVIRSAATDFHYEREAQPLPQIGPWRETRDGLLTANEAKPSRERLTLIRDV